MKNRQYNHLFKMVLVGNSNVGKSSIVLRFADGQFNETYITTIGVDFRFRSLQFDNKKVKLQIWDTAGQERFRTITSSYYKGAHAVIITYDITNQQSFKDATNFWYHQIRSHCQNEAEIMLVGNKSDLEEKREVSKEEVDEFARANGLEWIETSAKESQNIEGAFIKISKVLIAKQEEKRQRQESKKLPGRGEKKEKQKQEELKEGEVLETPQGKDDEGPQKLIARKPKEQNQKCCPY